MPVDRIWTNTNVSYIPYKHVYIVGWRYSALDAWKEKEKVVVKCLEYIKHSCAVCIEDKVDSWFYVGIGVFQNKNAAQMFFTRITAYANPRFPQAYVDVFDAQLTIYHHILHTKDLLFCRDIISDVRVPYYVELF